MKKNIVIVIMTIMILLLGGYLVYDKVINDYENSDLEVNQQEEQDYDLVAAKQLVDKYYHYILGNVFFTNGLTEKTKMVIAFSNLSNEEKLEQSCDSTYSEDSNATYQNYWYSVNLNSFGESKSAFCDNNTKQISYENMNNTYKSLFGSDKEMPKEDLAWLLQYDFKDNYFYELNCHCGGAGPDTNIYGIKNTIKTGNKLIISVGYINLSYYSSRDEFYNSITGEFISANSFNESDFKEKFVNQYLDRMDTYEFTFEKENDNYVLKDMVKKLYS